MNTTKEKTTFKTPTEGKTIPETPKNVKRITSVYTDRVKELRERRGLTQQKLADKIGVTIDLISKIETKIKPLTLDVAWKIAEYLKVSIDYLFGRSDIENENARHILFALRDIFKITSEKKIFESNILPEQECLTLSIDEHLYNFIKNMENAEKLKSSMSEKLYSEWVKEMEQDYNSKIKEGVKGEIIKYQLIDPSEMRIMECKDCPYKHPSYDL